MQNYYKIRLEYQFKGNFIYREISAPYAKLLVEAQRLYNENVDDREDINHAHIYAFNNDLMNYEEITNIIKLMNRNK